MLAAICGVLGLALSALVAYLAITARLDGVRAGQEELDLKWKRVAELPSLRAKVVQLEMSSATPSPAVIVEPGSDPISTATNELKTKLASFGVANQEVIFADMALPNAVNVKTRFRVDPSLLLGIINQIESSVPSVDISALDIDASVVPTTGMISVEATMQLFTVFADPSEDADD